MHACSEHGSIWKHVWSTTHFHLIMFTLFRLISFCSVCFVLPSFVLSISRNVPKTFLKRPRNIPETSPKHFRNDPERSPRRTDGTEMGGRADGTGTGGRHENNTCCGRAGLPKMFPKQIWKSGGGRMGEHKALHCMLVTRMEISGTLFEAPRPFT